MPARRLLVALVAAALAALCTLLGPPADAAPAPPVTVHLDGVSPQIATAGKAVTVTGSISNDGAQALPAATAVVSLGSSLLDTPSAVQDWYAGRLQVPTQFAGQARVPSVPAGGQGSFRVRIPASALRYPYGLASLPMLLQISGITSPITPVRTVLLWSGGRHPRNPLQTSITVPLTLPADPALFGPSGQARLAAWQAAIGPGSRVDQLLTTFSGMQVTWVVDPALVRPPAPADDNVPPPAQTAAPTPSPTATGTTSPPTAPSTSPALPGTATDAADGQVDQLADQLLARLGKVTDAGDTIWWTPYDDPDLTALAGSAPGRAALTRILKRHLPAQLKTVSGSRIAWPAGDVTASTERRLTATWREATGAAPLMLLSGANVSQTGHDATHRAPGTAGTWTYDPTLSSIWADAAGGPAAAAQHLLAATMAIYQEAPGSQRSLDLVLPRANLTTAYDLGTALQSLERAGWLAAQGTPNPGDFPRSTDVRVTGSAARTPRADRSPIDASTLAAIARQRHRLSGLGGILVDSTTVVADRTRALLVPTSTRWRGAGPAMRTVLRADGAAVSALLGKVTVRPSTVNFFADSGRLSVTVVNNLNRPVQHVLLSLSPRKYQLRIRHPDTVVQVGAGTRAAVPVRVQAIAAGQVPIDVRLTAPSGVPLGEAAQVHVNVRPTGSWIYWVVGIVAGLVLVVGVARTLLRGPRPDPTPGLPDPNDPQTGQPRGPEDV